MSTLSEKLVERLRKNGCRVRVTHKRRYNFLDERRNPVVKTLAKFENAPELKFALPTGGRTEVQVTTPNGNTLVSGADCSVKDHFNKRLGVRIAIGRLNGQIQKYLEA